MYEEFYNNPIIQALAVKKKWTISNKDKVPIDMTDLLDQGGPKVHGALTKMAGHNPFVDLHTLMRYIPNAANNAYSLDAQSDGVIILDIEPKCPKDIAEKLLSLPAYYGEFSLSGKGYHLILPLPNTFTEVYSCSMAVKEEHGYYEFLCNHCVTFTRNIIPAGYAPGIAQGTYDDYISVWNELASKVNLDRRNISLDLLSEEEETEWTDYIQNILRSDAKAYNKEPSDFNDDMSRYEHGYTSHIYFVLYNVLRKIGVSYSKNEMIWEVYRASKELIPYRDKHDSIHNGMPWLLYEASVVVNRHYDESEFKESVDAEDTEDEDDTEDTEPYVEDASAYSSDVNNCDDETFNYEMYE